MGVSGRYPIIPPIRPLVLQVFFHHPFILAPDLFSQERVAPFSQHIQRGRMLTLSRPRAFSANRISRTMRICSIKRPERAPTRPALAPATERSWLFRIRNNQDLSQIGNRKGLAGEKSSLFFQAIRIIREMREATNGLFPAIAVWENVMGAFSSNDRMDFRAVLSAFTDTDVSMPASGRWAGAGMVRGRTPDLCWRLMDAQHWSSPRLARRQRIFLVADFGGRRSHEILFKPRTMQSLPAFGGDRGLPAACGDRGSFIEARRRVPVTRPFQCFRMRASAKERTETAFRNSFGLPTDPFPTLLAGGISPFAFWYEDDPAGGCVRFPTETECARLMGLPEGWTRYGADGEEILSSHRYRALGNAIALPCAEYIMAGIAEALTKGGANDGI